MFGWERPRWFAPYGWDQADIHSFHMADWHKAVAGEVANVLSNVRIPDLSAFSKFEVSAPDAVAYLTWLSAGRIPSVSRVSLMYLLTEEGILCFWAWTGDVVSPIWETDNNGDLFFP